MSVILLFDVGGVPFFVGVSDLKVLSLAFPLSRYVFVNVRDLDKFGKTFSDSDVKELRALDSMSSELCFEDFVDYVKVEFESPLVGGVFKREVLDDEYLKFVEDWCDGVV